MQAEFEGLDFTAADARAKALNLGKNIGVLEAKVHKWQNQRPFTVKAFGQLAGRPREVSPTTQLRKALEARQLDVEYVC
jgi:hypothetical protein